MRALLASAACPAPATDIATDASLLAREPCGARGDGGGGGGVHGEGGEGGGGDDDENGDLVWDGALSVSAQVRVRVRVLTLTLTLTLTRLRAARHPTPRVARALRAARRRRARGQIRGGPLTLTLT